jgi:hypothetical protein
MGLSIQEIELRLELLSVELEVLADIINGIEKQANELNDRLRDV